MDTKTIRYPNTTQRPLVTDAASILRRSASAVRAMRPLLCADNFVFGAIQYLFWAGFSIFLVFTTGYMESLHYSGAQIGYVRAAGAGAAVIGAPLWGIIADKTGKIGAIMVVMVLSAIAMIVPFMVANGRFVLVLISFTITAFFLFSVPALIDSWITQVTYLRPAVNFSITRAMGSLGFATSAIFAGRAFDAYGIEYVFPAYAAVLCCVIPVIAVQIWRTQPLLTGTPAATPVSASAAASAAASATITRTKVLTPPLRTFLIICLVLFPCFVAAVSFMPLLMTALGGSHKHVGVAFSIMAASEVPFMLFSAALLRRFRDTRIIFVAFIFFAFRVFGYVIVQTPTSLIAVQLLQGASFGLFITSATSLLSRITRRTNRTRALSLLNLVLFGTGDIISGLVGGWIISVYGIRSLYVVFSIVILFPVGAYWLLFVRPSVRRASMRLRTP